MSKQLLKLIEYTNNRLAVANLTLSDFGKQEIAKRFNKKENEGGYSDYWKNL